MGFRFRKSFGKGPLRVTVSKSGIGYSTGVKGFRVTKKANGGTRTTASIPGTGISYVKETGNGRKTSTISRSSASGIRATANVSESNTGDHYCAKCYRKLDYGSNFCPNCGVTRSTSFASASGKKKIYWQTIVGLICILGAFAMLSENLLGTVFYVVAAVLLLRKGHQRSQEAQVYGTIPSAKNAPQPYPAEEIKSAHIEAPAQHSAPAPSKEAASEPAHVSENPASTPTYASKPYRVTGMEHYLDNILDLAVENPDYNIPKRAVVEYGMVDETIWKYDFYPIKAELVPEPENPYDPKAIKVIVDDKHIGYIKSGSCAHLLNVINEGRIRGINCEIGGGPYKKVYKNEDDDTYEVERGERNYSIRLTVFEGKP